MDAAALLLLVSGLGVAFGWQPMPDGSQRYEYIVQVEPEVAKTLAEGQSIPVVGDIPEEVQPVGRIRLVVGREAPPRQRLVTHLKPTTGATGEQGGVELAQYNRYGDSRYAAAPPAVQPPSAAPQPAAAGSNLYAQAQSAAANQEGGETSWNNDEPPITPTESAPPSGAQLFGQQASGSPAGENSWNSSQALEAAAETAGNVAADSIKRLGRELENVAQPEIQKGMQRIDREVRGAADAFGDRTRQLMSELQEPLQQPQLPADDSRPAASSAAGGEQSWNQGQDAAASMNPLRGGASDRGATWNDQAAASTQSQPPPRTTTAPTWNSPAPANNAGGASIDWNTAGNAAGSTLPQSQPQQPRGVDPWAGVPDPRPQAGAGAGTPGTQGEIPGGLATRPLPYGGLGANPAATGPQFPNVENSAQQSQSPVAHAPGSAASPAASVAGTQGDGKSPVVRSDMLQQPADRPLDGEVNQPVAVTNAPSAAPTAPAGNQWGSSPQTTTAATPSPTSNAPAATTPNGTPAAASGGNTVAVLAAWVLLSGSIAGNLYLFWSYLDVRQKYRALVRKTARAVGSRFSAA